MAAVLVFSGLLAGCTTMKEGFRPKETADISVFADNPIALLSDSDFGMQKDAMVLTREYFDYTSPVAVEIDERADEIDYYQAAHNEFDKVYSEFLQDNARARLALIIWARAHQKMASGILEPAKWFDISETPGMLIKLGSKALL